MAINWKPGKDRRIEWAVGGSFDAGPKPTYDGAVLSTFSRTERVMSDIWEEIAYAKVWTGDRVADVGYGSSYGGNDADVTVDATPDVLAAVAAWEAAEAAARAKADRLAAVDRAIDEARRIDWGKDVTVVRGRKVPRGTTGRVFWMGNNGWGLSVGIETPDGARTFTAASNVEVSNPDDYFDVDELMARVA